MPTIELSTGQKVMVDMDVADRLSRHSYHRIKSTGMVQRAIYSKLLKKTTGRKGMAHDVLRVATSKVILFRNGNKLDCRRQNLVVVKKGKKNMFAKLSSANSSGYRGVSYNKKTKKYDAYIRVNYKKKNLGSYNDILKAAVAYNRAAKKSFGKDAKLNIVE